MPQSYLFRGTTIGYKGNSAAIAVPYTCTSSHPVKALWFALECVSQSPGSAVVYLVDIQNLSGIERMKNCLESAEDELAFRIRPTGFYPLCEGYIYVADLQKVLLTFGIDTYQSVRKGNLTLLCQQTQPLSLDEINLIVGEIRKYLKK